jgi:hypothetical protein
MLRGVLANLKKSYERRRMLAHMPSQKKQAG